MIASDFAAYPTGNLCNADPAVRPLSSAIKPLIPGQRIAGTARTVRITPGQNGAIHRSVHTAQPGDILVVDGAASDRFGPFGDLLADGCKAKGIAVPSLTAPFATVQTSPPWGSRYFAEDFIPRRHPKQSQARLIFR